MHDNAIDQIAKERRAFEAKKAKVDDKGVASEETPETIPIEPESDADSEGEGPTQPNDGGEDPGTGRRVKRRTINLLEGGNMTRVEKERKVADDEDEMRWATMLVQSVEGVLTIEESQKIYDDLTGKELDPEKVKEA